MRETPGKQRSPELRSEKCEMDISPTQFPVTDSSPDCKVR